jgi:hypothetical protein
MFGTKLAHVFLIDNRSFLKAKEMIKYPVRADIRIVFRMEIVAPRFD